MIIAKNLTKIYGDFAAVNGIDFSVSRGESFGLLGPNGAGKTTFFNLISGGLQPDSGKIWLEGENMVGLSRNAIVHKGIGRAFQVAKLFKTLTVEESLRAALQSALGHASQMHGNFPLRATRDRAHEVMAQLGLQHKADTVSGNLSHGDQKLLDMALALVMRPKVLLLDEPVAGMGPDERTQMMDTVQHLWRQGGLTIVLIEHDMELVFRVAQQINVLSYGKLLAQGTADEIRQHPKVIEAYLGKPQEHVGE